LDALLDPGAAMAAAPWLVGALPVAVVTDALGTIVLIPTPANVEPTDEEAGPVDSFIFEENVF
jgi:hypothetical protein